MSQTLAFAMLTERSGNAWPGFFNAYVLSGPRRTRVNDYSWRIIYKMTYTIKNAVVKYFQIEKRVIFSELAMHWQCLESFVRATFSHVESNRYYVS